jgi:quercetin dioxygenase-like cupin family protein
MASPFSTTVALRGEQSDGVISVIENALPARWDGPPLHRHEFDEAFYVLDGELTFQVEDVLFTAGPGALAFAPGGVDHTLANLGDAPARYLLLCTPAGFEGYFARLAAEAAGEEPPAWALAPAPPVTTVGGQIGERDDTASATPIAPADGRVSVLVGSEQSDGRIAVMENRVPAGSAGPRLLYDDVDELFWVLEGELTFQLGEERVIRRAGELAFAPRGVRHTFANHGDAEARTLIVCTPAPS